MLNGNLQKIPKADIRIQDCTLTSIDQRRRGLSSPSTPGFWYSTGARRSLFVLERRAPLPPPRTGMTRRIVLFERENTTTRKLLLTRSRATIRVFAGSSISFYLVTLSLRRRVEVRVTGGRKKGRKDREGKGVGEKTRERRDARCLAKVSPRKAVRL